jgi:Tol biopolymer transport system component
MDLLSRGDRHVWVRDIARGVNSRLALGRNAVWSPNGLQLAFWRAGKIYVKNADGAGEETVFADVDGIPQSWSADGKYLVYETSEQRLFLWPLLGTGTSIAVGRRDSSSRWGRLSPDGRYIAYTSFESGREEIFVEALPPATGRLQVSASGGSQPRWNRSSRELFFVAADRGVMAVDVQPGPAPVAGVARKLFQLDTIFSTFDYDVGADGKRLLFIRVTQPDLPDIPITVVC